MARARWVSCLWLAAGAIATACGASDPPIPRTEGVASGQDSGPGPPGALDAEAPDVEPTRDASPDAVPADAGGGPVCRPLDVVVYTQDSWNELSDALAADPSPCADHHVSIPAIANDKTQPRGPAEPAKMRARGPRFHAMAEFHWTGWSQDTTLGWYEKGVEFRRRMTLAGYDVTAGDAWAINELPSSVRFDAAARQNARDAVRGLHDGPPGAPPVKGAVFIVGIGQRTTFLSQYKSNLEGWLTDAAFFADMDPRVRFWGQETYADPAYVCVEGASPADWSPRVEDYVAHVRTLANAAPATTATPRAFLERTYAPLMNAAMAAPGYNTVGLTLEQMQHFVSMQIHAARRWSGAHPATHDTVGLAWTWVRTAVTPPEIAALASRIASAIHHAYDLGGGSPLGACDPLGIDTWCRCEIAGASFNDAWKTFATW